MGETPPYGMIGGIEETWHHRSPIRASILPDCGGHSVMSVPTAISGIRVRAMYLRYCDNSHWLGQNLPQRPFALELRRWGHAAPARGFEKHSRPFVTLTSP